MRVLFCLLLLALGSGCATLINGTSQKIPVQSEPPGATVVVDGGEQVVKTPTVLQLKRKHKHLLTFSLEGYEAQTVTLSPSLSGAIAGNILVGGLIGGGVDLASGGANTLTPSNVNVKLHRPGERPAGLPPVSTNAANVPVTPVVATPASTPQAAPRATPAPPKRVASWE